MHFLLSHLCVVTVGFWLLSIQPPDFLSGIHASCSLSTCGSAGANSTLNARVCMEELWLPQTQWLGKGWTRDPTRANEIPWDFCWDFWDKQALSLRGEEIWIGIHVTFRRKEPNHRKQSWKREKPGTGGERETRYLWRHFSPDSNRTWNHLSWALQLQEPVLFPLHFNCFGWVFFFVMQRIQTNAEFSQSVVSSLS